MKTVNLNLDAQRSIDDMVREERALAPDQLKIPEIIPGCEVISLDPQNVGLATFPRYITVTINEFHELVRWNGAPVLVVGGTCTVVKQRGGNTYQVSGSSGAAGTESPTDVYRYVWVYDVSENQLVSYTTIPGALAYPALASGDYVLIPPGIHDVSITLVDGVIITEMVPGSVILHSTSADTCVTCADGGYINVKEIRCTRGAGNNPTAIDASGLGANETSDIHAEWIKGESTEATGAEEVRGIKGGGLGILHVYADYIDADIVENGGGSSCYAVEVDGDTFYVFSDSRVDNDSDGTNADTYNISILGGECYWKGSLFLTGDNGIEAYNIDAEGGILKIWGDISTTIAGTNSTGGPIAQVGGTVYLFGNTTCTVVTSAYGPLCMAGTAYLWGRFYAETTGIAGGEQTIGVDSAGGTIYLHGDALAVNAAGIAYGARCTGTGALYYFNGRASGTTFDIIRVAGTFRVSMVDFDTYSGTITQYYPMVDDAWIGIAGGAGARLVFDTTPAPDRIGVRDADLDFLDGFKILLGTGQDGQLYSSGDDLYIENATQDQDIYIRVNDGGVTENAIFVQGSTGNVGIGTPSPSQKLHMVSGNTLKFSIEKTGAEHFQIDVGSGGSVDIGTQSDDHLRIFTNNTEVARFTNDGKVGIGTTGPDRLLHPEVSDAVTNAVTYGQRISHITSNTAVAGFGVGTEFELEENDGTNRVAGILECLWTDAGEGVNADADFVLKLMQNDAAAAEKMRLTSGAALRLGGAAAVAANAGAMLAVPDNGADPTPGAGSAIFYAKDVSAVAEAFAVDEAGNATQLTAHNYEQVPPLLGVYHWAPSFSNTFLGIAKAYDMERALVALQNLTGETYIHERAIGTQLDWDAVEIERKAAIEAQRTLDALNQLVEIPTTEAFEEVEEMETITELRVEVDISEAVEEIDEEVEEPTGKMIKTGRFVIVNGEITEEQIPETRKVKTGKKIKRLKDGYELDEMSGGIYRIDSLGTERVKTGRYVFSDGQVIEEEIEREISQEAPTGRIVKRLKVGVEFDSGTGKFYRHPNEDEISIEAFNPRPMPDWMTSIETRREQ